MKMLSKNKNPQDLILESFTAVLDYFTQALYHQF